MVEVEFNLENLQKCLCSQCQVQSNSECAIRGIKLRPQIIEEIKQGKTEEAKKASGVFCSIGSTLCSDSNFDKMCQCGDCEIYQENQLNQTNNDSYYCKNGKP